MCCCITWSRDSKSLMYIYKTHNSWGTVSFLCTLSLSFTLPFLLFPLPLSRTFSRLKANHVKMIKVKLHVNSWSRQEPRCHADYVDTNMRVSRSSSLMQLPRSILLGSNTSCVHHRKGCRAYCRETMQTFPGCRFRNVDFHRKKRSGYCIRREKILITLLCKVRVVKHRHINKWSGFVSHWSKRKNAGSELSHVRVIKGNTYQQGTRLWHNTRVHWVNARPFTPVLPQFLSLSLSLFAFFASTTNRVLCLSQWKVY